MPPESFDEYRLVKLLGRGSMGQVWLAHDTVLDRLVAVKFIAERSAHDAVRQRFLTEARAGARVQHPNIIAVYRVGEIGERPYLISEYVRGDSLDKVARPVAWPRLRELAIGLARGLAAAHRQGVLHRDLKPANAIVSETGEVKLLDFGLAKLIPLGASPDEAAPPDHETDPRRPDGPAIAPHAPHATREPLEPLVDPHTRAFELPAGAVPGGSITLPEATPPGIPRARQGGPPSPAIDLSPSVTPPGFPRARESRGPFPSIDPSASVTRTGAVMGTPAYMPPEAWRGEPATPRSDIYSLGALLYALGAGAPPHRGEAPEVAREAVLAGDAPPLASAAPGIDHGFAAIVDRCLRRDPAARFASGNAVLAALEALSPGDQSTASVRTPPRQECRPRRRMAVAVALALASALVLFAYNRFAGKAAPGGCPGGMVRVPAGTFRMGSPAGEGDPNEQPQHEVTLSAYCIDTTEVTVAAYAACVAARRCSAAPRTVNWNKYSVENVKIYDRWCNHEDRPDHPINCVDWDQAAAYCTWKGKRLPTEAEWEYAARGSDDRMYPWGKEAPSTRWLNVCGGECEAFTRSQGGGWPAMYNNDDGWATTAPVGSYPEGRSPFGALDMAGNVWEWTADWYGDYATQAETNPQGPRTGTSRVLHGSGWCTKDANKTRAAYRMWNVPMVRDVDLGFRCARGD